MGKPTVRDIAKEAGVSLATVDRVLNSRPGVRARTVQQVQDAITKLGYVRDVYAANLARQRQYEFVVVLPEGTSQFLAGLHSALTEAANSPMADRMNVRICRVDPRDPQALARQQAALLSENVDGVAIMGDETPLLRDMIIRLKENGRSVVALITDQPNSPRDHFVGIDNRAAGRTAGVLMGRFVGQASGRVAVVVNSTQARDMVERRLGLDEVLSGGFPHIRPLASLEGHDDHELTARVMTRCLSAHPDIVGVYCAGAGLRGVVRAVDAMGLTGRVVVLGHDLTPYARSALSAGQLDAVIDQNRGHIARSVLRVLRAKCDAQAIVPSQEKIRIDIVIKENLP